MLVLKVAVKLPAESIAAFLVTPFSVMATVSVVGGISEPAEILPENVTAVPCGMLNKLMKALNAGVTADSLANKLAAPVHRQCRCQP